MWAERFWGRQPVFCPILQETTHYFAGRQQTTACTSDKQYVLRPEAVNTRQPIATPAVVDDANKGPEIKCWRNETLRYLKEKCLSIGSFLFLRGGLKVPCSSELNFAGGGQFGSSVGLGLMETSGISDEVVAIRQICSTRVADFCIRRLQEFTNVLRCEQLDNLLFYRKMVQHGNTWYLARTLCEWNLDEYLGNVLRKRGLVDFVKQTTPLIENMFNGLFFLHSHVLSIFHGNLKPNNLLVDGRGMLRLVDFGLGKLCSIQYRLSAGCQTADGSLHPVCWKPPEYFRMSSTYTGQSDMFSAAMLAFYMLTGGLSHPFVTSAPSNSTTMTIEDVSSRICDDEPDLVLVTPEATHLLEKTLKKSMPQRPDAAQILSFPFFWTTAKRTNFLLSVASTLANVSRSGEACPREFESAGLIDWRLQVPSALLQTVDLAAEGKLSALLLFMWK